MGNSRIDFFGETLIDLTNDTVTPDTLAKGVTAHNKAGNVITGTAEAYVDGETLYIPFGTVNGNTLEV